MGVNVDYIDRGAYESTETHHYPRGTSWFLDDESVVVYTEEAKGDEGQEYKSEEKLAEYNVESVIRVYFDDAETEPESPSKKNYEHDEQTQRDIEEVDAKRTE